MAVIDRQLARLKVASKRLPLKKLTGDARSIFAAYRDEISLLIPCSARRPKAGGAGIETVLRFWGAAGAPRAGLARGCFRPV